MVFRDCAFTLIGLISVVTLTAGVSSPVISNADPATPAPTPGDRSAAVTFDNLLRAPVPALCQHDPGNLVHGQLPPQDGHPGNVGIALNYTQPVRITGRRDSRPVSPTAGYSAGQLCAHMHADRLP
jgi:hypothetical protein